MEHKGSGQFLHKVIEVNPLSGTAIYVNRARETVGDAIRGRAVSEVLTEHRCWTSGQDLLERARQNGEDVAFIFAQYETLEFWAIAREILVKQDGDQRLTQYRFSDLHRIPGQRKERKDLTVASTNRPLPNQYIRSYVLVKTPNFLRPNSK